MCQKRGFGFSLICLELIKMKVLMIQITCANRRPGKILILKLCSSHSSLGILCIVIFAIRQTYETERNFDPYFKWLKSGLPRHTHGTNPRGSRRRKAGHSLIFNGASASAEGYFCREHLTFLRRLFINVYSWSYKPIPFQENKLASG